MSISLYIHIPFCRSKCFYCDFYSVDDEPERKKRYVDLLLAEIALRKEMIKGRQIDTLFIGGGTPSVMEPDQIKTILDACCATFEIAEKCEVTMEMNPESVTCEKAVQFRQAGVNRVSLGIQSFNDTELKYLQRAHSADDAHKAVTSLRHTGFENLSIDLIYGLPHQVSDEWKTTLATVIAFKPNHISCYELTPEPETPFGVAVERKEVVLDEKIGDQLYDITEKTLSAAGYDHYEVSNYAQPGYECRHNLGYWHYRDYLGLGAAAHSTIDGVRYANPSNLDSYSAAIPPATENLTKSMMQTERLMMGLRLRGGIVLGVTSITPAMVQLIEQGLLIYADGHLRTSARGFRLLDSVLCCL